MIKSQLVRSASQDPAELLALPVVRTGHPPQSSLEEALIAIKMALQGRGEKVRAELRVSENCVILTLMDDQAYIIAKD